MSETMIGLRRKISSAGELQSVVRTMKALAATSIGQYEDSVRSLEGYYRAIELGLGACFRTTEAGALGMEEKEPADSGAKSAIVFGSDQGLVGRFNEVVADYAIETLGGIGGEMHVWAVGARVATHLAEKGVPLLGLFTVPNSVTGIAPLIGQIQIESETHRAKSNCSRLYVFNNRPQTGSLYEPVGKRLLPLDAEWRHGLTSVQWPTRMLPQVLCSGSVTLRALIREYLFISLFRACALSLSSENASRLAAMERAEKNIEELLENLHGAFHRLRQSTIDDELFDVISGFDATAGDRSHPPETAH